MTEIGKTALPGQPFKTEQEKIGRGQPAEEKRGQASGQGAVAEASLAMKAKIVDFLLAVKAKSASGFAAQSGVAQQGAGKGVDLEKLQYNGKSLAELSHEEAQTLIADDGYFGVAKTAGRIADFMLTGGGDNLERLQAGREGVLRGFQEAEQAWGGKLPEISYQTLTKALELIDARVNELGGSLIDVRA
ncbi:MAG: hypothetical protein WC001_09830 [Desulfurivibrionaceae bacterium]